MLAASLRLKPRTTFASVLLGAFFARALGGGGGEGGGEGFVEGEEVFHSGAVAGEWRGAGGMASGS